MRKILRVGVLFGGRSGEHEVSLESAASVISALDPAKYEVVPIGIARQGSWFLGRAVGAPTPRALAAVMNHGEAVTASADAADGRLISSSHSREAIPRLDVVFPVLHGTFGEDGTVQGFLELAGVPYVGAGVLSSAVGMDKDVMKRLFRDAGLPVTPWVVIFRNEWESHPSRVRKRLEGEIGYPAFAKPANLGSSVGISKIHHKRELGPAIDLAAKYDRKLLVEQAVDAREIECAVLGNDEPRASVAGEIIPVHEFYDYDAKYVSEGSRLIIPAPLDSRKARQVRELALRAFKAIDGAGMARVDFLMDRKTGRLWVNEINTIPGFTSISMFPKLWEASGLAYPKLLDRLIHLAIERHRENKQTQYRY
ncbi:MAG: D-alanine--D-alanine ligase family protein [Terriglobia bacterium]